MASRKARFSPWRRGFHTDRPTSSTVYQFFGLQNVRRRPFLAHAGTTASEDAGSAPRPAWARLIVFSGHIDNYERHEHGGIPFFVTGGGGAHAYPIERDPKDAFQSKDINYHYLLGEVDGRTLKLTMNRLELKNRKAAWTEPDSLTVVAPAARSARTTK